MTNVGQIRSFSVDTYLKSVSGITLGTRSVLGTEFKDTVINCAALDSSKSYYFSTRIKKEAGALSQKINIRLRFSDVNVGSNSDELYQNLKTIVIGETNTYYDIEIIFTPNAGYDQISFDLVRTDLDYGDPTRKVTLGTSENEKPKLYEVINVIDDLKHLYSNPPLKTLKQIGVRSEPGLRMCINGEEILVGPSGVYELYNGMQIKYLGFIIGVSALTSNKKSDFILDFTYEGEE